MRGFEADYWRTIVKNVSILLFWMMAVSASADIHLSQHESYTQEAASDYCQNLGKGWRQLTIYELFYLTKSTPFTDNYSYWSQNVIASGDAVIGTGSEGDGGVLEKLGYSFFPKERNITLSPLTKKIAAACTDLPEKKPVRAYQSNKTGTLDTTSGVYWHNLDSTDKKGKYSYDEAVQMCSNLTLEGKSWRLPTLEELYGIVDIDHFRPSVDMNYFGPMMHRYYWSSDTLNEKEAYVVGFKLGSVATVSKKEPVHVRCVSDE